MKKNELNVLSVDIDNFDLKVLENKRIDKLVLEFKEETQIEKFNKIYPELLLNKIYPLTKGIPFCKGKIEHCVELFSSTGLGNKKKECNSCQLKKYCNYNLEDFDIKSIRNAPKDLLKFLEERNESLNDWI